MSSFFPVHAHTFDLELSVVAFHVRGPERYCVDGDDRDVVGGVWLSSVSLSVVGQVLKMRVYRVDRSGFSSGTELRICLLEQQLVWDCECRCALPLTWALAACCSNKGWLRRC